MMILGTNRGSIFKYIWRNTIAGLVVLLLWYVWLNDHKGYSVSRMLPEHWAVIRSNPDLSLNQRWELKLGSIYQYFEFLKANTPPNAVILYPTRAAFFPDSIESMFKGEPYNKIWATRFLYPRRLVLRDELATSVWGPKITHVAIVNKVGYDIFDTQSCPDSSQMVDFTVLQIK